MNGNEQTFSRTETMHLKAPFFSGSEASSEKVVTILYNWYNQFQVERILFNVKEDQFLPLLKKNKVT
jgi:hypothetical protein